MPTPFSGGCACGAIRYECSAEPLVALNCHCRDCQRASGSAFASALIVPKAAFRTLRQNLGMIFLNTCHLKRFRNFSCSCRGFCPVVLTFMKGTPKYHRVTGDSGNPVERGFCPECGSPVLITEPANPAFVEIQAASLDDPSWVEPVVDIFTASAQPWDHMNPALPKFERSPTEDQIKEVLTSRGAT